MAKFKIAHIREQGVDIIIAPLEHKFGNLSKEEQSDFIAHLQDCAHRAGLAGTVVPAWQEGNAHRFIAPDKWYPFFKSFGWNDIIANLNKELTCG